MVRWPTDYDDSWLASYLCWLEEQHWALKGGPVGDECLDQAWAAYLAWCISGCWRERKRAASAANGLPNFQKGGGHHRE